MTETELRHAHIFCGLGGGKKGFNRGHARAGNLVARFRCIGGVDVDPAAIADFNRAGEGRPGVVLDLFSRAQYEAFHGHEPPAGWEEITVARFRAAFGEEFPNIVFLSAPCKGFSGLLSEARSRTGKYQALNELTLRGVWLALEAWKDDPPEAIIFENVPRIANRGRRLLDQIVQLLRAYGYAVAETTHDCGEIGGLAQSRKRFLLIARHVAKVPPFIYQPVKRPLRAVGEVLERFPLPGAAAAGPMHRMPALQWKTWVRLAFVEAGSDWRSLQKLRVADGVLADYLLVPELFRGSYGVTAWDQPSATVTSKRQPSCGGFSVADPRIDQSADYGQLGVRQWHEPTGTVSGQSTVGGGAHAIADPRIDGVRYNNAFRVVRWSGPSSTVAGPGGPGGLAVSDPRVGYSPNSHRNKLKVIDWHRPAATVTGGSQVQGGALSIADPRAAGGFEGKGKYIVTPFDAPANTVISGSTTGNGAFAVQDPRFGDRGWRSGPYGVLPWTEPALTVASSASPDNGFHSVADPRLPEASDRLVAVIRALDGTWHRPFTTLELAALQGLVDPEEHLELEGLSDSAWRERIGNAVPPPAAAAVAGVIGRAILGARAGDTFELSAEPVWVRPIAVAWSAAR